MTLGADGKGSLTDAAAKAKPEFTTVARANDDLAAILYTSGTTGRSKGAMLTHDNLASNSLSLVDYWRFTDKDVLIHALPIYHTHGLFVASNVTLFAARLDDLPAEVRSRADHQADGARDRADGRADLLHAAAAKPGADQAKPPAHMRLFISGSAPLLADTHREWSRAHRTRHPRALWHDRNQHEHLEPL